LRESAIELAARVEERGLLLSVDAAEAFLAERHASVVERLGLSERSARQYLDEGTLRELADQLVADFAEEAPGADLFALARSSSVSVSRFGRLIAALAESILFFEQHAGIDDVDREGRVREVAELLSVAGVLQSQGGVGAVAVPPALCRRIARVLDGVAALTDDAELASAVAGDAAIARAAAQ